MRTNGQFNASDRKRSVRPFIRKRFKDSLTLAGLAPDYWSPRSLLLLINAWSQPTIRSSTRNCLTKRLIKHIISSLNKSTSQVLVCTATSQHVRYELRVSSFRPKRVVESYFLDSHIVFWFSSSDVKNKKPGAITHSDNLSDVVDFVDRLISEGLTLNFSH